MTAIDRARAALAAYDGLAPEDAASAAALPEASALADAVRPLLALLSTEHRLWRIEVEYTGGQMIDGETFAQWTWAILDGPDDDDVVLEGVTDRGDPTPILEQVVADNSRTIELIAAVRQLRTSAHDHAARYAGPGDEIQSRKWHLYQGQESALAAVLGLLGAES